MSTHVQHEHTRRRRDTYDDHLADSVQQIRRDQYIKGVAALLAVALVIALLVYGFIELAAVA